MVDNNRAALVAQLTGSGEAFELVPGKVFGRDCLRFKNAPATLRTLFAEARSEAPFIVYQDERMDFAETYAAAARVATVLVQDYGIEPGDRVAISMRNYPEWILSFMAVTSIGGIAVAMNALWRPDEMAFGLADSGAKVLIADQERLDRFAAIDSPLDVRVIAVRPEKTQHPNLADLVAAYADVTEMPDQQPGPEDDATLMYTSGSTGNPKGVASCHVNIVSALMSWELDQTTAIAMLDEPPPEPEHPPATLLAVPLFHATGSLAVYLASYRHQRKLVSMYKWDPSEAARLIEQEHVTGFIAPAAMTGDLIIEANHSDRDLSSLLSVGGGGAPRAPDQVRNIEQSFAKAMPGTGWGMTETNAIGTSIGGQDYLDRPASSGRCSAVLELQIVDDDGNECPTLTAGELLVRGTSIFRGYWNRPDANAETFVNGDWMRTGDVAYLDEEGFLFIVDRIKDLVIRGGENIGCGEVEAALLEHPLVYEASVYAVPDERLGEEVGTTLYTERELSDGELNEFLGERLAKFKIPTYVWQQQQPLPRTASGKILKRELREQAAERIGA
jgi:long-chain acyl-CoA synthetase